MSNLFSCFFSSYNNSLLRGESRERERESGSERENENDFRITAKKIKFFFHFFQLFSTSGFGRISSKASEMLSSLVRAAASRAPQLAAVSFAAVSRSRAAASSSSSTRGLHRRRLQLAAEAIGAAAEATPRRGFGTGEMAIEKRYFVSRRCLACKSVFMCLCHDCRIGIVEKRAR